jgi:hypothetical protein
LTLLVVAAFSRAMKRAVIYACVLPLVGCAEREAPPPKSTPERPVIVETEVGISSHAPIRRAPPQFDDADPDAVKIFYDVLAAYGMWTDDSRLGFVWMPSKDFTGADFVPYGTHGRWSNREVNGVNEWVWVSDLPWGWVAFHYGRWAYTGERGWAWIASLCGLLGRLAHTERAGRHCRLGPHAAVVHLAPRAR